MEVIDNPAPTGYCLRKRTGLNLNEDAICAAKDWFGSDSDSSEGNASVNRRKRCRPANEEIPENSGRENFNSSVDYSLLDLPFACPVSDKRFERPICVNRDTKLVRVPNMHLSERTEWKYPCSKCDKKFSDKSKCIRHKKMHSHQNPRPVPCHCTKCFLRFIDAKSLARHFCNLDTKCLTVNELPAIEIKVGPLEKQQRRSSSKRFDCKQCEKSFSRMNSLTDHMSVHTTETFNCSLCDKSFKRKGALYVHNARAHQGQYKQNGTSKRIQCKYCPRWFCHKQGYILHERRKHTGTKPYGCPICYKRFVDSGEVKYHVMFHTGERPYKCTLPGCSKSYTRNFHLQQHKRIHNGERPYSCRVCTKTFGTSNHCSHHEKNVHKYFEHRPKPVENQPEEVVHDIKSCVEYKKRICQVCGKEFGSASNCTGHEKHLHECSQPVSEIQTEGVEIEYKTGTRDDYETVMITGGIPEITKNSKQQEALQRVQRKNRNCRVCGKGFRSPSHRKRHEQSVHKYKEPIAETQAQPVSNTGDHQDKDSVESITGMDMKNEVDAIDIQAEPEEVQEDFKIEPIHVAAIMTSELDITPEIPFGGLYCPYCHIIAQSGSELEEHARTNHADPTSSDRGSPPFRCPHLYCSNRLKSVKDLKIHQRNIHNLKDD